MIELALYKPLFPFNITQGFGQNLVSFYKELGLKGHNGLDCTRMGEPVTNANVRAAQNGLVIATGIDNTGGYAVHVRTEYQMLDKKGVPQYWQMVYYHLTPNIKVRPGQRVTTGDVLGLADTTGRYTTGPHLHFGLKCVTKIADDMWETANHDNGYFGAVDPLPYLHDLSAYEFKMKYLDPIRKLIMAFQKS